MVGLLPVFRTERLLDGRLRIRHGFDLRSPLRDLHFLGAVPMSGGIRARRFLGLRIRGWFRRRAARWVCRIRKRRW